MGYFSNASEGDFWQANNCIRCAHYYENMDEDEISNCPVWLAHLLFNYNESFRVLLDLLIPYKNGHSDRCAMFIHHRVKDDERTEK